jgi:hypothetical protein
MVTAECDEMTLPGEVKMNIPTQAKAGLRCATHRRSGLLDFAFCSLRYWIMTNMKDHRLSCNAIAWIHDGPQLSTDEQHAFRYEVRGANGVVGFIDTDRARSHPDVHWTRELLRDGKIEKVKGTYATVEEALAAF